MRDKSLRYVLFFLLLLLVYLLVPGPGSIDDFPALPQSVKSTLSGDTVQVPNVKAYFSNNYRDFVTKFYRQSYQSRMIFPFGPLRLNYPPEFAFTAIKDQTQSTYLEEYVYPLRDSLFVNGLEPFDKNGQPRYWGSTKFEVEGKNLYTKVTLRFYPSNLSVRLMVWLGIGVSTLLLWKVSKKIVFNG